MLGKSKFQETWYQWIAILIVTLVLAGVLFVIIEPAAGFSQKDQYYNVPIHSIKEANYNPDPHPTLFAKLDLRIIAEVIRDHEGPSMNMADRMMTITSVLSSPVPTITPYRPEISAIGNDDASSNRNTGEAGESNWSDSSTETMNTSTPLPTGTTTLTLSRPVPSDTPTDILPTSYYFPSPGIVLPSFTPSITPTKTKTFFFLPSPSPTSKPARKETASPSPTLTIGYTPTRTMTTTETPTLTNTPSPTPTATQTATGTATQTPTPTMTNTATSTGTLPVCPSSPISLTAVQDSWIDETKKDQNYGAAVLLIVHPTGGFDHRALIQFDLSSIPPDCTIASAILILNQVLSSDQVIINIFMLNQAWDEMTVTWNNPPGYDNTVIASFNGNVLTPSQRFIDITNLVNGWCNNSFNNFGILLGSASGNGNIEFESRESSNPPILQIELGTP